MSKRIVSILTVVMMVFSAMVPVSAVSDREILSDPVENTYTASMTGESITKNISFSDVADNHWAKEAITRLGALEVVKGYNEGNLASYRPNQAVTNEETLAFLLRVIGQEAASLQAAENIASEEGDPLLLMWSRGYLQVAANLGLITNAELGDALQLDQTVLDPALNFIRTETTSREQAARWIVDAINTVTPGSIDPIYEPQAIFTLNDWETIGQEYIPYVESVMQNNIMVGDGNSFDPQGELTRAQMAQIIVNIDDVLYDTMNLTLKGGLVGAISDAAVLGPLGSDTRRTILIRNDDGKVDQVDLDYTLNEQGNVAGLDVPVYGPSGIKGLGSLKEGDHITYVVDDQSGEMKYIYSRTSGTPVYVTGVLQPFDNIADGDITIENEAGMKFTYKMIDGLYDSESSMLKISFVEYPLSSAPVTNTVTLKLQNNLVTEIQYDGAVPQSMEVSGIVKEINPTLGFMTIQSWDGIELTKYFNKGSVIVEKQNYYDNEDEIGYIDEVFPDYRFDERDTTVDAIEAGDIVHLLLDPSNLQYATKISAKTNYTVKFGEVTEIADKGAQGLSIRVIYDDDTVGVLSVQSSVPVMKSGSNIGTRNLEIGDMIKILMNQAVLAPGETVESVKHLEVDAYGNVYSKVYKGEFGTYNKSQMTLGLLNSYELSKIGWTDHTQMTELDIPSSDYEVYYNGERTSLEYADNFLRTSDMKLYVVTREYFDREEIARVVFEDGRDEVLSPTNVVYSNGYDTVRVVSQADSIGVNPGTIVIKNDHIVSTTSILSPDYAQVVMGDEDTAVVVNVMQEPTNDAVSVMRGRISSIEQGESFTVTSHAVLKDMTWIYSPIEREYLMSYDTKIIEDGGIQSLDTFIDYTEASKVDEVYTVVAEGTKATHLIKNPYATEGVVGTVYDVSNGQTLNLKDALVYDSSTKLWEELSYKNSYADVNLDTTTIIIKNNKVVDISEVAYGDQVRAMITVDLAEQVKLEDDHTVTGHIIFVEE